MCSDSINFGVPSASATKLLSTKLSAIKRRMNLDLIDSDEEFDEWLLESLPEKLGLVPSTRAAKLLKFSSIFKDLIDSDDEFDEWFLESIPKKYGLLPRTWMSPMNKRREIDGEYVTICLPLRKDPAKFFKYYRMSVATHDYILNSIKEDITKYSNRPSISPGERLAVTLRYLSTGLSFASLAQTFLMNDYTIGNIVRDVCAKIYEKLRDEHMPVPSQEDFKTVATEYERLWQFPNCLGAIDGKHVRIKRGTIFLQAVADAHYRLIFIDVGSYGKQSSGEIIAASSLSKYIDNEKNFPPDPVVQGLNVRLPYLFVGDDAYPLKKNMMKSFSGANLTEEQDIFNGRLSRARRCVECAFGIMTNKWRLLLKNIDTTKEYFPESIIKCITILHNVVINKDRVDESLLRAVQEKIDAHEASNVSLQPQAGWGCPYNHPSNSAAVIRNCWMEYFNSNMESVSGQDRCIKN